MPNWVFNSLNEYTPDLYEKYKSEDYAIDFDKIIPEPEDIKNTISGSYNRIAKEIYEYKKYKETRDKDSSFKYDYKNPLHDTIRNQADRTCQTMGELVIEHPDESLNSLLEKYDNRFAKTIYDEYVQIFGNRTYGSISTEEIEQVFDNYCELEEKKYQDFLNLEHIKKEGYKYPENLDALGKQLIANKEKYGFDNWYDWRIANWGTKWNACDSEYDEETNTVKFDTAWSIPYQIISKIAQDNPDAKLDGYSEEEQGWFDEYHTEDGKVHITCHGEWEWPEEENAEPIEHRKEVNEEFDYNECADLEAKRWESFINGPISKI